MQCGESLVDASQKAGVRRVVFSSVIHPTLEALQNHRAKAPVESAILASGMEYTLLHPAVFFHNLRQSWPKIVKDNTFAQPWSAERRFSWVDYRDVAEVAALALTEDRLLNGTFELCAPGSLNRHDVADLISEVLGRHVAVGIANPDNVTNGENPTIARRRPCERCLLGTMVMTCWETRSLLKQY